MAPSAAAQLAEALSGQRQDPSIYDASIAGVSEQRQTALDKLLSEQASNPQEAVGKVLAATIPVGIAALFGGASDAGLAAGGSLRALRNDQRRTEIKRQQDREQSQLELQVLGQQLTPLLRARELAVKQNADLDKMMLEPTLAAAKSEATYDLDIKKAIAGRSINNVTVNPQEAGPPLTDTEVNALIAGDARRQYQFNKYKEETGVNPTFAFAKEIATNKLSDAQKKELAQTESTIAQLGSINSLFNKVKDTPPIKRAVVGATPDYIEVGEDEKLLNSQVANLAIKLAVQEAGAQGLSEKDREAFEKTLVTGSTAKGLGERKLGLLMKSTAIQAKAKKAALGAGEPVTPEEYAEYTLALKELASGDDAVGKLFKKVVSDSSAGVTNKRQLLNDLRAKQGRK